jgi:hypothetical protein
MSNITVSVDEATYRSARIVAAEQGVSVSALVRNYLQSLRPAQTRAAGGRPMSLEETFDWAAQTGNFSAAERYTREQLYDRDFMRKEFEQGREQQ